jgi:hypothetical protein
LESKANPNGWIMPYATQYGEDRKPLPITLSIAADAELKPGTDLRKLRWIVAEMTKWPDELGEVAAIGDFSSGLLQTVTLKGKWLDKGICTYVWVDGTSDDIRKCLKFKDGVLPEALRTPL